MEGLGYVKETDWINVTKEDAAPPRASSKVKIEVPLSGIPSKVATLFHQTKEAIEKAFEDPYSVLLKLKAPFEVEEGAMMAANIDHQQVLAEIQNIMKMDASASFKFKAVTKQFELLLNKYKREFAESDEWEVWMLYFDKVYAALKIYAENVKTIGDKVAEDLYQGIEIFQLSI